jgi:CO/xanthine dehydrogenase Mo-binding subunit
MRAHFRVLRPTTPNQASALKREHGSRARYWAGGTDTTLLWQRGLVDLHLSSGDTEAILVRGAERFRWKERFAGWGKPYTVRGPLRRAVGVGTGAHVCGVEFEGATSAVVRINPDGSVKVFCSAGRQGQGSETTQSQVAAEALGVRYEDVEIETGDTDACPWSHGSLASNTTRAAALDARRQLLAIAAREFFEGERAERPRHRR